MMRRRRWIAAAALAVVAVGGLASWHWAAQWRPDPATFAIQGVDVGEAQGAVDWAEAKGAGVQFAYLRATDGTTRDTRFAVNWQATADAGVRRGALHVFSLCRRAIAQADAFVTTVPRTEDALPVAVRLDFDDGCTARPSRDAVLEELRRLLTAIETHTNTPTLLMITRAFDAHYQVSAAIPRNLWSVQPFFQPGYFPRPWRMWQASRFRTVAGIERPANWDVVAP